MNRYDNWPTTPKVPATTIVSDDELEKIRKAIAQYRPNMHGFAWKYPISEVKKDEDRVKDLKRKMAQDGRRETEQDRLALVFEAIFDKHIEVSNWLGQDTTSYKTSEYDDYVSGIDSVLDLGEESRVPYLALGIDVTTSEHRALSAKFNNIFDSIRYNQPTTVKYLDTRIFTDKDNKPIPNIQFVKLIVGANLDTVKELHRLERGDKNNQLSSHFIQHQILDELILQCQVFRDFAQTRGPKSIADAYDNVLKVLLKIKDEKEQDPRLVNKSQRDSMMETMKTTLESCRQSALIRHPV